jgi:hypothetical protein
MGKRVSGSLETKTYGKSTMANMAQADSVGGVVATKLQREESGSHREKRL